MRGDLPVELTVATGPPCVGLSLGGRPSSGGLPATPNHSRSRYRIVKPGLSDRLREGPDTQQELGIVPAAEMGLFLEVLVVGELGSHITGE